MSTFGELIDKEIPVVLFFYTEWSSECKNVHPIARNIAATFGDDANVVKIDVDKNQDLSHALRIKGLPTMMVYQKGVQTWRKSGNIDESEIIDFVREQIKS